MKGVPAVENGDIGMSCMRNTDSGDEKKQQRFSDASLSCCPVFQNVLNVSSKVG